MPIFGRRSSVEALAKAVAAELQKADRSLTAAVPPGTAVSDLADLVRSSAGQATPGGLKGYFESLPRTDPDVPFSPGRPIYPAPIDPLDPEGRTPPRTYQGPVSWNLNLGDSSRLVPFTILRQASEVDLVRRCIEIRKSDIISLEWDIVLNDSVVTEVMATTGEKSRAKAAQVAKAKYADVLQAYKHFWSMPDRMNGLSFSEWLSALLEELLVTDAVSIYPHPALGRSPVPGVESSTHSLRLIDGSTIKPLYDHLFNLPGGGQAAYQQVLYGFPRGEYSYDPDARGSLVADQLMYRVRNKRIASPYGLPPVEQALPLIDLWLAREKWLRAEYGVGVKPPLVLKPTAGEGERWTPLQRRSFERLLNEDMSGQTVERHLWHILPPGLDPVDLPQFAEKYNTNFDDFLALRLAAFFDVMSTQLNITPKGGLGGKGHQEGEDAKSEAQARRPTVAYLTDLLNDLNVRYLGAPDVFTFVFRSTDEDDINEVTTSRQTELFSGQTTLNDIMSETGRPLFDFAEADMPFVIVPGSGIVFLEGASEPPPAPSLPPGADPEPAEPPVAPPPAPGRAADDELKKFVSFAAKRRGRPWRDFDFDTLDELVADQLNALGRAGDLEVLKGVVAEVTKAPAPEPAPAPDVTAEVEAVIGGAMARFEKAAGAVELVLGERSAPAAGVEGQLAEMRRLLEKAATTEEEDDVNLDKALAAQSEALTKGFETLGSSLVEAIKSLPAPVVNVDATSTHEHHVELQMPSHRKTTAYKKTDGSVVVEHED